MKQKTIIMEIFITKEGPLKILVKYHRRYSFSLKRHILRPAKMTEIVDSTKPYMYYVFSCSYIIYNKVELIN